MCLSSNIRGEQALSDFKCPLEEFGEGQQTQREGGRSLYYDYVKNKLDNYAVRAFLQVDYPSKDEIAQDVFTKTSIDAFQPTVAGSSTEAEFMAAYKAGKMILFVRNILWDLGIPQEAATLLYEDNGACTAMANAQKPTPRTRRSDIKY